MSNTVTVDPLPGGKRKVTVHSDGERDLSAVLLSEQLDELVRMANNAEQHVVGQSEEPEPEPTPAKPSRRGKDAPPVE